MEEVDNSGNILARYTHGDEIDQPLAGLRSGSASYYQQDVLNSITSLSNPSGALTNTYTYDSFGKQTASTGTLTNSLRYTGREWDTETNLQFSRARYFDPDTGRFVSEDPWNFYAGDPNFYRYVANDPTDFIDPSGNKIVPSPGPGAGAGINIFNYQTATAYLKGDPSCGAVINKLENSPRIFTLEFIHNGNDDYDPNTHTIQWDPLSGLACGNNNCRQSPALGLCHKMAHAAGDGPIAHHMAATPDNQYDNREERRVIRTYETPFAIRHGECVRHNHGGQPVNVATPTSHWRILGGFTTLRKCYSVVLLMLLFVGSGARAETPGPTQAADELSGSLQSHQIVRLEILHVSDNLLTRTRITPESLRQLCKVKVVIQSPWESASFPELLRAVKEVQSAGPADAGEVRWAILFFDGSGKERSAIFLGRDGRFGIFENVPLSLQGKLLGWSKAFIREAFLGSSAAH
jgi:RHS repeat-associated protein